MWCQGLAQAIPFRSGAFRGAYATWAYYFPDHHDIMPGLSEILRVVEQGGPICIVDNLGDDEFTALSDQDMSANPASWEALGFETHVIETAFEFDTIEEARKLLGFYFGDQGRSEARRGLSFRVGCFVRRREG